MIRLNILVQTLCGVAVFYVSGNDVIISRAYRTSEAAERFLNKKLADFGKLAIDQYHII